MSYTIDELAAYAEAQGLVTVIVAGFDTDGNFHFASTDGNPEDIKNILTVAVHYLGTPQTLDGGDAT